MDAQLLTTKLYIPPLRAMQGMVPRPRLMLKYVGDFKDVLKFEVRPAGWYPAEE